MAKASWSCIWYQVVSWRKTLIVKSLHGILSILAVLFSRWVQCLLEFAISFYPSELWFLVVFLCNHLYCEGCNGDTALIWNRALSSLLLRSICYCYSGLNATSDWCSNYVETFWLVEASLTWIQYVKVLMSFLPILSTIALLLTEVILSQYRFHCAMTNWGCYLVFDGWLPCAIDVTGWFDRLKSFELLLLAKSCKKSRLLSINQPLVCRCTQLEMPIRIFRGAELLHLQRSTEIFWRKLNGP